MSSTRKKSKIDQIHLQISPKIDQIVPLQYKNKVTVKTYVILVYKTIYPLQTKPQARMPKNWQRRQQENTEPQELQPTAMRVSFQQDSEQNDFLRHYCQYDC